MENLLRKIPDQLLNNLIPYGFLIYENEDKSFHLEIYNQNDSYFFLEIDENQLCGGGWGIKENNFEKKEYQEIEKILNQYIESLDYY